MSLKAKYILFIGLLHTVLVILIYYVLEERKWVFLASETLVLLSLYLSYLLYQALIKPITLMQSGVDAIAEKDFSVKYLKTGSAEIDKLVGVFNTMIDSLREERTYTTEQSYFIQNLLEVSPLATVILDLDGCITLANPAARSILQLPSDCIEHSLENYDSELIQEILKLPPGEPQVISINGLGKYKCQVNDVIHQGFKRRFYIVDDLSSELLQSEKEAYGKIIRMMAHEVNNSMGAVNSILDTVVELGFDDEKDEDLKDSLHIAMDRNTGLAKFMDNYASLLRLPQPSLSPLDLNVLLKKTGQLFVPKAKKQDISIEFDLINGPITVMGDAVLLEQTLSNIIKNAIEAIESDGDIIISSKLSPPSFSIRDNGGGIPEDVESKLFTPFFSTKPTGQGVGLMLIRDVLTQHGTDFSLSSDQESGWTEFSVRF